MALDSHKEIFEKIRNLEKHRKEEFNSDGEVNNIKMEFDVSEKIFIH
jgi:hypothetical protein